MRTWLKPQFWQLVSTRTPGWNFSPWAMSVDWVRSKSFVSSTFTSDGASRRIVSLRVAETTTSSMASASSSSSKLTSTIVLGFVLTFFTTFL